MRRILSKLQQQRGQVIVMFIAIFTVLTVVGVITVDFGLWFSERRGAQTDADLPALAGAREYMLWLAQGNRCEDAGAPDQAVEDAVDDWFSLNNGGNASLVSVDANCPCVDVTVKHDTEKLFSSLYSSIFDEFDPDNIGARARACAGAANNPQGTLPIFSAMNGPCFKTDEETPNLGAVCPIKFDSSGTPETGLLDLLESGACSESTGGGCGSVGDNIENGTQGMCLIADTDDPQYCTPAEGGDSKNGAWYECVAAKSGNCAGPALTGLKNRLTTANDCGSDFEDTVIEDPNAPGVYEPRDCDANTDGIQPSPRLVTIFILKNAPDTGGVNKGQPIQAFAGFFIEGCATDSIGAETGAQCDNGLDDDHDGKVNDGCTSHGSPEEGSDCNNSSDDDSDGDINDGCPSVAVSADLNLTSDQRVCDVGTTGHEVLYGRFLKLIMAGSGIGPVDPSSTMFSIALVDWEGGGGGTPEPTAVSTPAPTVAPTATPVPPPTATNTPKKPPTDTPGPTDTPKPTKTPKKP